MNERERELIDTELDWYINEQAIPQRSEFGPQDPDEQEVEEELQAVQASLEGYAYGVLRIWRLSQSQDDQEIDHTEDVVEIGDLNQIAELVNSKMIGYMEQLEEVTDDQL